MCAQDELDMCKIRLQLKEAQEPNDQEKMSRIMKHLSYNTESKLATIHLISVHEVIIWISFESIYSKAFF